MRTLDDVKLIEFPVFPDVNGTLVVYEGAANGAPARRVPFVPVRTFTVRAPEPALRGQHAHRHCHQLLVCVAGSCRVRYTDGAHWREITLNTPDNGLHIPPTIWAEQHFAANSILMVLCDLPYTETDYVRAFSDFLDLRRAAR